MTIVTMMDTIGSNAHAIPSSCPKVGCYVTGSGGIQWSPSDVKALGDRAIPIWQKPYSHLDTASIVAYPYLVVDVEHGAATISDARTIQAYRKAAGKRTAVYHAVSTIIPGFDEHWIANWNLTAGEATALLGHNGIVAVQWASPTSNPSTIAPGTGRTLAECNIDLSEALGGWPNAPEHAAGLFNAAVTFDASSGHWSVRPTPGSPHFGWTPGIAEARIAVDPGCGRWTISPLPWGK